MSNRSLLTVEAAGPLETVRHLLARIWQEADLEAMLVPIWKADEHVVQAALLYESEELSGADPFSPVMLANGAPLAAQLLRMPRQKRLGVVLRPCELRSLRELARRDGFSLEPGLLISPDCVATLAPEDYDWQVTRQEDNERLTRDALHFAAQGGILPSRLRPSCQLCDRPFPESADIHIQLLGVETSRHLLVEIRDPLLAQALGYGPEQAALIPSEVTQRRERVLGKLVTWRQQARAYAESHLGETQGSLEGLSAHLRSCPVCRERMNSHCPFFARAWKASGNGADLPALEDWLLSCAGCGMCEYACPEGFPLFTVISHLGHKLTARIH
jgi:formate dehydrogenase subunit beta